MAPKKAEKKRTPSPISSSTSSSDDEPENQALKTSSRPMSPQSFSQDDADERSDDSEPTNQYLPSTKRPQQQHAKNASSDSETEESEEGNDLPPLGASSDRERESESKLANDLPPSAKRESRIRAPSVQPAAPKPRSNGAVSSSKKRPEAGSPCTEKLEKEKKLKVSEATPSFISKGENNERFKRIWSDSDETAILQGLVDFKKEHGRQPTGPAEIDELYGKVKKSLHANFSRFQLEYKLVNLKRRYSRLLANGKLPKKNLNNASHVKNAWNLAKEVWGGPNKSKGKVLDGGKLDKIKSRKMLTTSSQKSKGDGARKGLLSVNTPSSNSERGDTGSSIIDLIANQYKLMDYEYLKENFALLDPADCKVIEELWNYLRLREMELESQRLEAVNKIIKVLKDIMESQEGVLSKIF